MALPLFGRWRRCLKYPWFTSRGSFAWDKSHLLPVNRFSSWERFGQPLPSIEPSACAMPSRCLCFHAQVRPLPAQATSLPTYLYPTPSHFRLFHCPVSCLPSQRVFSFPLYNLFVSLGELSEPNSVTPTKQRQARDCIDFLFLYRFL